VSEPSKDPADTFNGGSVLETRGSGGSCGGEGSIDGGDSGMNESFFVGVSGGMEFNGRNKKSDVLSSTTRHGVQFDLGVTFSLHCNCVVPLNRTVLFPRMQY
jgi:hypothetical protein